MNRYGYNYSIGISIDAANKILQNNSANTNLAISYNKMDTESGTDIVI